MNTGKFLAFFMLIFLSSTSQANRLWLSHNFSDLLEFVRQPNQSLQFFPVSNELWNRNDYEGVGAILEINVDNWLSYPKDGDIWFVNLHPYSFLFPSLGEARVHYDGATDCLIFNPGSTPVACSIRTRNTLVTYRIPVIYYARCQPTIDYMVTLEYQLAGDPRLTATHSPQLFKPTRFRPAFGPNRSQVSLPINLKPKRYAREQGETGDITISLKDNFGCGSPIPDASITLTSVVVGGTNGQTYLSHGERGTGRFISTGYSAEVDNSDEFQGTRVQGKSDFKGEFKVSYQAQNHGAQEIIELDVKLPETETEPEFVAPKTDRGITLSFPGLVNIESSMDNAVFNNGTGCPHSPPPRWLTPRSLAKMKILAEIYFANTGRYLSLNDASLPLGGVIANLNNEGRDKSCHGSHRFGIDIDINTHDSEGRNIQTETIEANKKQESALEYMDEWVKEIRGEIHHTHRGDRSLKSIHWRLDPHHTP